MVHGQVQVLRMPQQEHFIGSVTNSVIAGTELDAQCKKWRLVADLFNDVAYVSRVGGVPGFFAQNDTSTILHLIKNESTPVLN